MITKIRTDYGVQINLPKRGEADDDIITIQGYEDKALQAKEAIMAIVHQLVSISNDHIFKQKYHFLLQLVNFNLSFLG